MVLQGTAASLVNSGKIVGDAVGAEIYGGSNSFIDNTGEITGYTGISVLGVTVGNEFMLKYVAVCRGALKNLTCV